MADTTHNPPRCPICKEYPMAFSRPYNGVIVCVHGCELCGDGVVALSLDMNTAWQKSGALWINRCLGLGQQELLDS